MPVMYYDKLIVSASVIHKLKRVLSLYTNFGICILQSSHRPAVNPSSRSLRNENVEFLIVVP